MKKAILSALAAAFLALATPAMAAPITVGSNFSISGLDVVASPVITFSPGNLNIASGDFAGLGTCTGCVTLNPLTFTPVVSSGLFFTISNNGLIANFTLDPGAVALVTASTINVTGTGIVDLTGFDPTLASLSFTTQNGFVTAVTFSASLLAVPEPISLALIGTGLLGIGLVRRKRAR